MPAVVSDLDYQHLFFSIVKGSLVFGLLILIVGFFGFLPARIGVNLQASFMFILMGSWFLFFYFDPPVMPFVILFFIFIILYLLYDLFVYFGILFNS